MNELKWQEIKQALEAEGFRLVAFEKNALGGDNQITGMSFWRGNIYINLKRVNDDKFDLTFYNANTDATSEKRDLTQEKAWDMAKSAAKAWDIRKV